MRYEGLVDIDDALLRMDPRQFTQTELKAIQRAPDVVVVLATGRTRFRARPLLEQLDAVGACHRLLQVKVMVPPGSSVPGKIMLLSEREVRSG